MQNRLLIILNDIVIFLLVFSIFNDDFLVLHFGENILKIIFILFIMFNTKAMLTNFKSMHLSQDKIFFTFFIMLIIVSLIRFMMDTPNDFVKPFLALLSMIFIILFYGRYPLKKLFYFIWIAMMTSIVICYFNEPTVFWSFRKSGGTADANTFAAEVLAFIFTTIYLFKINRSRLFLILSVMAFLYGIFYAGSKSAFLVLGILLIFLIFKYLIYNFKSIFNYKFILLMVILGLSTTQINLNKIEAVSNMLDRTKSSRTAEYRFMSWRAGQHMFEKHPLIGVGTMQFVNNTQKYSKIKIESPAAHNLYIQLLAESGIIVFLLFVIFIAKLLIQNFSFIINNNFLWIYLALLSILLMGLTLSLTYHKALWLYIAILMNINNSIIRREQI